MHIVFAMRRALVLEVRSVRTCRLSQCRLVQESGLRNQWCSVPQEPGSSGAEYPRNQKPVVVSTPGTNNQLCLVPQESGTSGAQYPSVYARREPGSSGAEYPRNQEPVVLCTPGTRNQWCLVPQESGTSGARYPRVYIGNFVFVASFLVLDRQLR